MNDSVMDAQHQKLAMCSKKDRLEQYYKVRFKHSKMEAVTKQVLNAIQAPERNTVVHLIGPARVGKTTLLEFIVTTILREFEKAMEQDREIIPVALLEAQAPNTKRAFDFSEFYRRVLCLLDEVGVMYKRSAQVGDQKFTARYRQQRWIDTFNGRRESLESVLTHRRLEALLIDESHTMALTSAAMQDVTVTQLKSLANMCRVPIVLCGTYELLGLSQYDAQIIGRSVRVHFSRYHPAVPQNLTDFHDIVCELIAAMPMHEPMNNAPAIEFFVDGSLGLVGALKQWMLRALREAIDDGSKSIKKKHFESTMLSLNDRKQMLKECMDGEELMIDSKDTASFKNDLYKLPSAKIAEAISDDNVSKSNKKAQRPGQRKPGRDLVGAV